MNQNSYIQYQALVDVCQKAMDEGRSWSSCRTRSGGVCQVLASGRNGGIMKTEEGVVDDNASFCLPKSGLEKGMYQYDDLTGRIYFFDNLGRVSRFTAPSRSWFGWKKWKLQEGTTSMDAFLPRGVLGSIAEWTGMADPVRKMTMDYLELDPKALKEVTDLSSRARLLQRNMQMHNASLSKYINSRQTILDLMKNMDDKGFWKKGGDQRVEKAKNTNSAISLNRPWQEHFHWQTEKTLISS